MKSSTTLNQVTLGLALVTVFSLGARPARAQSACLDPVPNPQAAGWTQEGTGVTLGNYTPLVLVDSSAGAGDVINLRCTPGAAEFSKDIVLRPQLAIDAGFVPTNEAVPNTGVHVDINDGTKLIRVFLRAPSSGTLRVAFVNAVGKFTPGFTLGGLLADFTLKRLADGTAVLEVANPVAGQPPLQETLVPDDQPASPLNRQGVRTLEFGTYDVVASSTSRWTTLGLPTTIDVTPIVGTLSYALTTVNNSSGNQFNPHVSGNLVTYSNASGAQEIRYYDFASTADLAVPGASGGFDLLPDVSGTTIVFTRITGLTSAISSFDTATSGPVVDLAPLVNSQRDSPAIGGRHGGVERLRVRPGLGDRGLRPGN